MLPNLTVKELVEKSRELDKKATPGEWFWRWPKEGSCYLNSGLKDLLNSIVLMGGNFEIAVREPEHGALRSMDPDNANAQFIAQSRTLLPQLSQALSDVIKENERYQIRLDSEHDYLRKEMHEARQHLINAQHFMRTINCSSLEEASRVAHYLRSLDLIK